MSIPRRFFLRAARSRWLSEQFMRRSFSRRAVARFMPGERLEDALGAARQLATLAIGSIVTRLGESLTGETRPDEVCDHYLGAYDQIRREGLPTVVSVKPNQLGLDRSHEICLAHLRRLAQRAVQTGSQLWIDMEDSSYVDRTLALYREVRSRHEPVGIAIQAYLRRTPAGHRRDPEPESLELPQSAFEFHMLYGIRTTDQRTLATEGHLVRCLISYGEQWFPWYMRRLAERPANVWFVMRGMFMKCREHTDQVHLGVRE